MMTARAVPEELGVLVISREGSGEDAQVMSVKAEGGCATWVLAKDKFEYMADAV